MTLFFEKLHRYIIKVWPLLPAVLYLVGFQIIVLVYLVSITKHAGRTRSEVETVEATY